MQNDVLSYRLANAIIQQLVSAGIGHLIYSPGYRNSPLILAARNEKAVRTLSAIDERGAAFLALGLNKAGAAAAVLCTSGTAVANYFPAVLEASSSHCPLLVLTADRPRELVGTGANQVFDQTHFFSEHVRFFGEIPCPTEDGPFESHAGYLVEQAVAHSRSPKPGPVHVNIRFREPFLISGEIPEIPPPTSHRWKILPSSTGPSREQWEAVEAVLKSSERPIILLGPDSVDLEELNLLLEFSEKSGCPILAEKSCGAIKTSANARLFYEIDTVLESMAKGELTAPDLYIRIGAPLTGKSFAKLYSKSPAPILLFETWGEAREPSLFPSIVLQGGKHAWISSLTKTPAHFSLNPWIQEITALLKNNLSKLQSLIEKETALSEPHFHFYLGKKVNGGNLFLGNSMPIRDFQSFFQAGAGGNSLQTFSNRGLSGIDGLIASAVGVAMGNKEPTNVILGDLSTLHDLSSFSFLSEFRSELNLNLWVLNNGGGEIFRVVPTAKAPGEADWFTTPKSFDVSAVAKSFQLSFTRITDLNDWKEFSIPSAAGVRVIEVQIDSNANQRIRKLV